MRIAVNCIGAALLTFALRAGAALDFASGGGDLLASGAFDEAGGSLAAQTLPAIATNRVDQIPIMVGPFSFVPNPDLSRDLRSTGGTDPWVFDDTFLIDDYGPVFTTRIWPDGYCADWGFNVWSDDCGGRAAFAVLPGNLWYGCCVDGEGTRSATPAPDRGLTISLFGMSLAGLGLLRRKFQAVSGLGYGPDFARRMSRWWPTLYSGRRAVREPAVRAGQLRAHQSTRRPRRRRAHLAYGGSSRLLRC